MKNFDLLAIIWKWKVRLVLVAGLAVLLSAIFSSSYFIQPKYKSTAVIYPSNLTPYSEESPTEQMIQLFQSDSIFNYLVGRFNLAHHYRLDTASPTLRNQLLGVYNENVSVKKTEYEAVKIEVLDHSPDTACEMIKAMDHAFNAYTLFINKQKSKELVHIFKSELEKKQFQLDSINTAIKELAVRYGIIDYRAQSRELSKEYYRSVASGNEKKITELTNALRNLEERGGKFHELQEKLDQSTKEYSKILIRYNTVVTDTAKTLTYTNFVVRPFPADKKSYPIRWLIVTVSACASLLFSLIVIMILEGRNQSNPI